METNKRNLKGSPSRDTFKQWHKIGIPKEFYACDIDLCLVTKFPQPGIVAFIDFKVRHERGREPISFSEVIVYNALLEGGYLVYIIYGDYETVEPLDIYQYIGGDYHPNPPVYQLRLIAQHINKGQYIMWENQLRKA